MAVLISSRWSNRSPDLQGTPRFCEIRCLVAGSFSNNLGPTFKIRQLTYLFGRLMQKKNKEGRLGPLGNRGLSRRGRERSERAYTGQDADARAHRLARPRLPARLCPFVRPFVPSIAERATKTVALGLSSREGGRRERKARQQPSLNEVKVAPHTFRVSSAVQDSDKLILT